MKIWSVPIIIINFLSYSLAVPLNREEDANSTLSKSSKDCFLNDTVVKNGESALDPNNPCQDCHCVGSTITCSLIFCHPAPAGCKSIFQDSVCCPEFECPKPSLQNDEVVTNSESSPENLTTENAEDFYESTTKLFKNVFHELELIEKIQDSASSVSEITTAEPFLHNKFENNAKKSIINAISLEEVIRKHPKTNLKVKSNLKGTEKDKDDSLKLNIDSTTVAVNKLPTTEIPEEVENFFNDLNEKIERKIDLKYKVAATEPVYKVVEKATKKNSPIEPAEENSVTTETVTKDELKEVVNNLVPLFVYEVTTGYLNLDNIVNENITDTDLENENINLSHSLQSDEIEPRSSNSNKVYADNKEVLEITTKPVELPLNPTSTIGNRELISSEMKEGKLQISDETEITTLSIKFEDTTVIPIKSKDEKQVISGYWVNMQSDDQKQSRTQNEEVAKNLGLKSRFSDTNEQIYEITTTGVSERTTNMNEVEDTDPVRVLEANSDNGNKLLDKLESTTSLKSGENLHREFKNDLISVDKNENKIETQFTTSDLGITTENIVNSKTISESNEDNLEISTETLKTLLSNNFESDKSFYNLPTEEIKDKTNSSPIDHEENITETITEQLITELPLNATKESEIENLLKAKIRNESIETNIKKVFVKKYLEDHSKDVENEDISTEVETPKFPKNNNLEKIRQEIMNNKRQIEREKNNLAKAARREYQIAHLARKYGLRPLTRRTFREDIKLRRLNRLRDRKALFKRNQFYKLK